MYLNAKNVALHQSAASLYTYWSSTAKPAVAGSNFADMLGGGANSTLSGGRGDDTYQLWDTTAKVSEKVGQGIDTVQVMFWGGYTLGDNVENLVLNSGGATWGNGNALNNILTAGTVGATLDGKVGDDVLVGGAGADIFKLSAGNGSDAIVGFQSGWDTIKLSGYGITSFAQLKSAAVQTGADVQIGFANGESLVMRNTRIADLNPADFGFSSLGGTVSTTMKVMTGASAAWNTNGVYALNMAWNPGTLKYGIDYAIESVVNPVDTSKNATFHWTFPTSSDLYVGIKAYPSLMFGVSPYGDTRNVADTAHTFPIKLTDLVSMKADFDTSFSGQKSGYNVAYDIWFTNTPNGGASTVTNELMIWTHKGSFDPFGTVLGSFDAGGVKGKIYTSGTYIAIVTDQDMPKGTIDLAAVFKTLQTMGILSANNYVASVQLGSEVSTGNGSLTVNSLSLTVGTSDGAGGTILKQATGAGTTVTHIPAPVAAPPAIPAAPTAPPEPAAPTAPTAPTAAVATDHLVKGDTVLDKLVAGGAQKTIDANGLVTGVQKTAVLSANKTETLRYDASATMAGRDVAEKGVGYTGYSYYGADNKMTGADQIFVNNGSTVTKHFNAWWTFTGQDVQTKATNGATVVQHFDAAGTLLMTDSTRTIGQATVKEWWNAKTGLSGVTSSTLDANGNGKIETFDGRYKLISYDQYSNVGGVSTVKHYDAGKGLVGSDTQFVDAGGVRVQQTADKTGAITKTLFSGTAASDTIVMSGGAGEVHGGKGSDIIWAKAGDDSFHFDTAIGTDVDTIHDFSVGNDSIYLAGSVFGKLPTLDGALADSAFALDTAKDANTRIIYDSKNGSLYYDADGTGSKAAVLFAHLDAGLAMSADHFHLI